MSNKKIKLSNKILVIPGWYPSDRSPHNGDFVKNQVSLLRKEGLNLDVVYADISIWNWRNMVHATNFIGVDHEFLSSHWSIPRKRSIGMRFWRNIFEGQIRAYFKKEGFPQLIHAHTFLGGWAAIRIAKEIAVPIVVTAHYTGFLTGILSDVHNEIAEETFTSCDKVYAVSHELATSLTERYKVSCQVVPNFIDIDLFKIKARPKRQSKIRIIAVGDLIPRKQIGLLLKAIKGIESLELIIAGDGPMKSSLIKHANQLDINVQFIGRQTQAELSEWYSQCDFLVHPSNTETFGLVIIEAMACGLPVITCDNEGSKNIINATNGVYLEASDHMLLKKAIIEMIDNLDKYDPLQIRKSVIERFAPNILAMHLTQEYSQLIT